jgi:hypothetical protein
MGPLNPEMDAEAFRLAAEAQHSLIATSDGALGSMRVERWAELASQLEALGLIETAQAAEHYFANPASD